MSASSSKTLGRKPAPILVKDLRSLRVLLLQPESTEGKELWEHLSRIGCQVQSFWPPPAAIPDNTDVVFLFMRSLVEGDIEFKWDADNPPAVLIAIVDYENPTVVEKMLRLKAQAVLGLPLRPFGVLANVLLSVNNHRREQRVRATAERLDSKLRAYRDVDKAKAILMSAHNISDGRAYQIIREQAMNKRATIETIAQAIINASNLLNSGIQETPRSEAGPCRK